MLTWWMLLLSDWQLQPLAAHGNAKLFQLIQPQSPTIEAFAQRYACQQLQQLAGDHWLCGSPSGVWSLKQEQQQWWLTQYAQPQPSESQYRWGTVLADQQHAGQRLRLVASPYNAAQIVDFYQFRARHRLAKLRMIQHGQFHIQLQHPWEDIYVFSDGSQQTLLHFSQTE